MFDLGSTVPEDTWHYYEQTFTNSGDEAKFFHSQFKIRFNGSGIDTDEDLWIDDVILTAE